ncbi:MAG: GntR family transcriptional regulator [Oscillospiraceae bacterium]|jgi:GntR family transcriptional regulator|nr:GntR family transcriptional regulator [Oscillospiraceae bacterium]
MEMVPAYVRVYKIIKREIVDGEYAIGELLPPEPELEKRFSVSRTTVRRAVDILSREGFVTAQQGRGTWVLDYKTRQNLNKVTSISETLRKKGFTVRPKDMRIDELPATQRLAADLGIPQGSRVVRIHRIQLADEKPIVIMRNHLIPAMVPGIERYADAITSLYQFLEDRYNINIDSAVDKISAKSADLAEAQMLQIPVDSALLYMRRTCYANGKPVCADRLSLVGDRYQLEVNMVGRDNED